VGAQIIILTGMTKWSVWEKGGWSMSWGSLIFAALPHETRLPNEIFKYYPSPNSSCILFQAENGHLTFSTRNLFSDSFVKKTFFSEISSIVFITNCSRTLVPGTYIILHFTIVNDYAIY